MNSERVTERAHAAGAIGSYLLRSLHSGAAAIMAAVPFSKQISLVYQATWFGTKPTDLRRGALSYLCADVCVQVPISDTSLLTMVDHTCPVPDLPLKQRKWRWVTTKGASVREFPLKRNPAAANKTNVFLSEIASALSSCCYGSFSIGMTYLMFLRENSGGTIYNDQAAGFLMYGHCLSSLGPIGWRIAASVLIDPEYSKGLSNFLKAMGANGGSLGSRLVEGITLLGRDVAPIDLKAEALKRVKVSTVRESVIDFPEADLRREIQHVLRREVKRQHGSYHIDYGSYSDHWDSRWSWAVNGAHSNLLSTYAGLPRTDVPGVDRVHRRAWLETIESDPRVGWDGTTYVSGSAKLEHGKTRAIFACDTVSYLAFEHMIGPVERSWRGERVVLNPGKGGHLGMAGRVEAARNRSGVSMMLDYDDFNSQHSTRAMQVLVEETCRLVGYSETLTKTLVDSFTKQIIFVGGRVGRSKGTLMSGHRLTTYINSVLNEVYLAITLGRDFLDKQNSIHVGDDVYLGVRSYSDASHVVHRILDSQLRMNPTKQSVGHVSTEFLRVASAGRYSYAYLTRGIASIIGGNWANDITLEPREALSSIVNSARSLANRSGLADVALLLVPSVRRLIGGGSKDDGLLAKLLTGRVALGNGPQFQSSGYYLNVQVTDVGEPDDYLDKMYRRVPINATKKFLATQASELEVEVLTRAGVSVERSMFVASWSKSLARPSAHGHRLKFGPIRRVPCVGAEWAEMVARRAPPVGRLSQYPLLLLARYRLPEDLVRYALGQAGGNPHTPWLDYDAWGEYSHGCVIDTVMSYSDAAALGVRTSASVLTSTRKMCV